MSKKTDAVIAGDAAGSKLDDARRLGVAILSEDDFKKWLSHYNITNPPLEFPIGIVIKPHRWFLKSIIKSKVEDVIFFKTWPSLFQR